MKKILCTLTAFLLLFAVFPGAGAGAKEPVTLNLALYTVIPDYDSFEETVKAYWAETHPETELNIVDWDCYSGVMPEDLDVFVIDAADFDAYEAKGALLPLEEAEIRDYEDLIPSFTTGCRVGGTLYALPQFLCTDLLYTRRGDTELESVRNLVDLYALLGDDGMLTDMDSDIIRICIYLQALMDENHCYMDTFPPLEEETLSREAVEALAMLRDMRRKDPAGLPEDGGMYQYARRFADGEGRVYIGYSESMDLMGDAASETDFRLISMTDDENIPVFYVDAAAINARIPEEKKALAFDLLNMITGTDLLGPGLTAQRPSPLSPRGERLRLRLAGARFPTLRQTEGDRHGAECPCLPHPAGRQRLSGLCGREPGPPPRSVKLFLFAENHAILFIYDLIIKTRDWRRRMKKTIGLLLAVLLLISVCGVASAKGTADEAKSICWADVAKEAAEADKAGEFQPLGDLGLMMWIPSNMNIGEIPDEESKQGLVARFSADDDSASLNCVWDSTQDKGLADWLAEVKDLGYADAETVTINGLKCISWTEPDNDCMKLLHIPDGSSTAMTLIFSPIKDKSFASIAEIMKHSLMPGCSFYENEDTFLPVADRYFDLVTVVTPEDDEYGELFSVSETASIEAAQATDQDFEGVGWLFSIARVTEDQLHEMLCYYMFGSEVFGKDEQGMYYLFNHPTDVRIVRESYDNMDDDMEIWSELNQWAWQEKDNFLYVNPGVHAAARGNSDPEIFLARTAWMEDEPYTISTTKAGPREPGDVDPAPYVEKLTTDVFIDELYEGEAPVGEYVVLTLPNERIRLDFFLAKGSENIIRLVTDDGQETLWQAEYEDGTTKASAIMQKWYDALKS